MLPTDSHAVLQWWITILFLGVGFLPLTILLFQKFTDKGYIFSKIIALAITSYTIFLFGVLHLTPFTVSTAFLLYFLAAGTMFLLLPTKWKIWYHFKKGWRWFVFEEILFLAALFFWAYIHGFAPDIHGLEKYMDYGFINSILRSDYFPPKDMWFTPLLINYYYFGHIMTAVLTKLSALPSNLTFNLMLSTIFAFCFVETFSIGVNLASLVSKTQKIHTIKRILAGFLTAGLVTFSGNLHIIYAFFKQYQVDKPQPFWELLFQPSLFPNAYWYPNATRYIYHTIHEFPIYSWVVADLHGHVLDIPFVLFIIALLFSIFMKHDPSQKVEEQPVEEASGFLLPLKKHLNRFTSIFLINPFFLIFIGFLLAVMYMTNAWDGAIYLMLTGFVLGFVHWQKLPEYKKLYRKDVLKKESFFSAWKVLWGRDVLLTLLLIIAAFTVFTMPYNAFFKPFASGIGVLCAPDILTKIQHIGPFLFEADHCQKSYWWELVTLYGFFYFFVGSFVIYLMRRKQLLHTDIFVLLLIAVASLLIIIPEFIYVKDIYPAHYRANTMFKLVFQAFIMMSIATGYIIVRLLWLTSSAGGWRAKIFFSSFSIAMVILVGLIMTYPYLAIKSYYGDLTKYQHLDGTAYLKTSYPSDYEAINWLNKNVQGQPVILEAQGDSYTDYGRVSINTGLPTVLGWTVHEWLWRGSYDVPAPRIEHIKTIYETKDAEQAKKLLKQYNVRYVFIGAMEMQKYPALDETKFEQLGKVVFQSGTTKIYLLNKL